MPSDVRPERPTARKPPFSNMAATGGLRDVPFPNMAARPRGHPHGGSAPSQHGGNLARLPALLPPLAVREARAARFPPEPASWWARGPETPAHGWSRGDDVRRSGATSARARAQSRAIKTRRRSVGQGRSLMRSRKVRGPAGGVRAAEPHSPRGADGGRAPLVLELRPWEGNPHSPPAPGGMCTSTYPKRGAPGSLPGVTATGTRALSPALRAAARASCPLSLPTDGHAAADRAQPNPYRT